MSRLLKVLYWVSTGIVLFLMLWAAVSYVVIHDTQAGFFEAFGYPTYLVYPLAALKAIGAAVIITHRYNDLRDMVYAAYFLNMILALVGHIIYGDFYGHALVGAVCLPISYLLGNKVRRRPARNIFGRWTDDAGKTL
ncbi:DoxX family protein [Kordiimonas aquimaris]|uniref:DoxX family protein n=1 Tax=Kordiimonas aquimaris TaxID=707591 RepID=UPI0021D2B60C|nr:DoxX family protein [Kordiimonas aquimaris]